MGSIDKIVPSGRDTESTLASIIIVSSFISSMDCSISSINYLDNLYSNEYHAVCFHELLASTPSSIMVDNQKRKE